MITFDSKDNGRYEFKGTGDDLSKDYIGITIALGRSMRQAGVPLAKVRESISILCAQGITLIEMPEKQEEAPNKIVDFAKEGNENV